MDSNVGEKFWKVVSRLGVAPKERGRYYKKNIYDMEAKDKKRLHALKGSKYRGK